MTRNYITRTFNTTTYHVQIFDTNTESLDVIQLVDNNSPMSDDKATRYCRKKCEEIGFAFVRIVNTEQKQICIGMPQEDFIQHGEVLDPVTRKPM